MLLSACVSTLSASAEVMRLAKPQGWHLIVTPYVIGEAVLNLADLPADAVERWPVLRAGLSVLDDVLTMDRPAVFAAGKDRPILFSATAWADVLLTLDRADFGAVMATTFYGLPVLTPGQFIARERAAGRL